MARIEKIAFGLVLVSAATPAFAGTIPAAPGPIAGVGIGAVLLLGIGYKALKRRLDQ